ncbi:hypothetical protein TURU_130137 [Turdus rufiventris]|nr:hypothetical protein TURU_130137 [Turdus rufiventris]
MAAETQTLNFGPEWLRALSSGGSVTSPPLSPALPKYKLADYRYGREEMLALFLKDNKIPSDLLDKEFLPILQEEPLPPLALVPFTEEEQRNFSMSVNSAAVLRLTGRGGGTVVGAPRGRSSSRGREFVQSSSELRHPQSSVAEAEEKAVSTKEVLMKWRVDLGEEGAGKCTDHRVGRKGETDALKNQGEKIQVSFGSFEDPSLQGQCVLNPSLVNSADSSSNFPRIGTVIHAPDFILGG